MVSINPLHRNIYIALAVLFFLYVGFAITPSHYGMALQYLGVKSAPLLGSFQGVRSDEWAYLTPLFQIAVRGNFSTIDQISPYHEALKGFSALPILDWSLIFKPQLWAFWVLSPAHAYSFYFGFLWLSFILGYSILLRQLGASFPAAYLGAIVFFFSHFVQVWWTSDAPVFALAPWPVIAFLLPIKPAFKFPILFWSSALWIFGMVYPPLIIAGGFALLILVLVFRRDALTISNCFIAIGTSICLAGAIYLYFGDFVSIMAHTVYPGSRNESGGSFSAVKLLAHFLPYSTTANFVPLSPTNACEISVVATMLPLATIFFIKPISVHSFSRDHIQSIVLFAVGICLFLAWLMLPVPAYIGRIFLWNLVPPSRMAWGFGMLTTLALIVVFSKMEFSLTFTRFLMFANILIWSFVISKIAYHISSNQPTDQLLPLLMSSFFDLLPIFIFGLALVYSLYVQRGQERIILLAAAAITGAVTFGTFNPFQQAFIIFDVPDSELQISLRTQLKTNPNGWAITPGMYGAVLNGVGIPSINHTVPVPQLAFFRRIFPNMGADEFNQVFNRYANIIPQSVESPYNPQADVVIVPIEPFEKYIAK